MNQAGFGFWAFVPQIDAVSSDSSVCGTSDWSIGAGLPARDQCHIRSGKTHSYSSQDRTGGKAMRKIGTAIAFGLATSAMCFADGPRLNSTGDETMVV